MKETFNYPKTLRNYEDQLKMSFINRPNTDKRSNKSLTFSTFNSRPVISQQTHNINEYCILTNPCYFKGKKSNKKKTNSGAKNKAKKNQSRMNQALIQQLQRPFISHNQIGPHNIVHCKSLQRLQIISNDRSEQIKNLITERGHLFAENQELRAKIINPTFREQQFIQMIAQREYQIQSLRETLKRKQQRFSDIEKQYKLEIQRLKVKHEQQMASFKQQMNKVSVNRIHDVTTNYATKLSDSPKRYQAQPANVAYVSNTNGPRYTTSNVNAQNKAEDGGQNKPQNKNNNSDKVINSTNYKTYIRGSALDKKISSADTAPGPKNVSQAKQNFQTYVGEDGYERRVYYKEGEQYKYENVKSQVNLHANTRSNHSIQSKETQEKRYSSIATPFANLQIKKHSAQWPQTKYASLYKYGHSQKQAQNNDNASRHTNKDLYSNSLTFQCFGDKS